MARLPFGPTVAIVVKGYPRLSETFIARELLALQERGVRFVIVSLRRPTDPTSHDLHERIRAPVLYLPEYLYQEPARVLRGLAQAGRLKGFTKASGLLAADWRRDPTANRGRRYGQAAVLAAELPSSIRHIHAHFIHTPASTARYAATMLGLPLSLSAHAKDIWTSPDWELREKLQAAAWTVTCTRANLERLRELAPDASVELLYHGIDLERFRPPPPRVQTDGRNPIVPIRLVSVARAVPKKGLSTLLDALAGLPTGLAWRLDHAGGGPLIAALKEQAERLAIAHRITWHGPVSQTHVVELLTEGHIFCLPARIAADGDRDGLPNVLLEAMACGLPVISTRISAIPEAITDGVSGILIEPDDTEALTMAILRLAREPQERERLAAAGLCVVTERFSVQAGLDALAARLGAPAATSAPPAVAPARCVLPSMPR